MALTLSGMSATTQIQVMRNMFIDGMSLLLHGGHMVD